MQTYSGVTDQAILLSVSDVPQNRTNLMVTVFKVQPAKSSLHQTQASLQRNESHSESSTEFNIKLSDIIPEATS